MSDSVRSHRWQPTRFLCPWDSPGKNTGVCCHFLLQKQRNQRSNYKHPLAHRKKIREFQKNMYFCFIEYTKAFDFVDHNSGKFLKQWEHQITLPAFCMQVKNQHLEPDMEQWTGSKLGKEYVKAAWYHPDYLTYMQSTSCEIPSWMKLSWNQDCQEKYQ